MNVSEQNKALLDFKKLLDSDVITQEEWTNPDGTRTRSLYIRADEPIRVEHTTSFGESYVTTLLPSLSCESAQEQRYTFAQKTAKASLFLIVPADKTAGFTLDGKVLRFDNAYAVSGNSSSIVKMIHDPLIPHLPASSKSLCGTACP